MSEYKDYQYKSPKLSYSMNYLLEPIIDLLGNSKEPILDLGCGNGSMVAYLRSKGYNAYGVDASATGINIAKQHHPDHFYLLDLTLGELPIELQTIDFKFVISTEVIEHLYDPRKFIAFCKHILNKSGGGELILTTPYHGYLKNLVISLFNGWDNHFTVLWDGGHIKFWSRSTLTQLLHEYDFEVQEFRGCGRIPYFWKSMLLRATI